MEHYEKMSRILKGELRFIGVVKEAGEQEARIHVFPEFCAGLKSVASFSHIFILYWMHLRDTMEERRTLLVFPKKHIVKVETGVFACRSPSRPNPIGLCLVELLKVEGCDLTVKGLDALEDSPVIDIKPYLPRADMVQNARTPDWTSQGPTT